MDFNLSEREKMIHSTSREFAVKVVLPRAAEIDCTSEFPRDVVRDMVKMGYFGLAYPAEYGGSGSGYLSYALVIEQLARASMTVGAIVAVSILSQESLFRFGSEAQKREFLVPLVQGKILGCFCFTEPGTGSDPKAVAAKANLEAGQYVIEGQKNFISMASAASQATVFAKDETGRISAFIVPTSVAGFQLREPCETLGLRGFGACVVYLDSVRVPKGNLLGEKGGGYEVMLEAISVERVGVAAQAVGVAQAALDLSVEYAGQRIAYEKPIARMPTIQWFLAEMASRIEAGRWLAYRTAFLRDEGQSIRNDSAVAKLFCSQMAVEVTRMAMQVHGAYGTMKSLPVERLYRDAKMTEVYVGVSEIQRAIIASHLIK
ncbi:MAG: acyl-CoA dehydrogenase family protein [Dehalococcoidia bacterium]|nr:acyl-CoA dehydrogenase family protein [Dehalococcoidia bacterium]